ncbi:MAG: MotA/TolQ/ExbB proton channel family protein [Polyangiaceae bacterium]|jgi:biopolymer transport protein TolQ
MTLLEVAPDLSEASAPTVRLDLLGLFEHAAWPVRITIGLLIVCSMLVWLIAVLKLLQVGRLRLAESDFENRTRHVGSARDLMEIVARSSGISPGERVLGLLRVRGSGARPERLRALADRAIVAEGQNARALMWFLAFIAAASPFIGLFGTVYGIMDAFVRIGAAKTASLPVVAPAIGEALVTTAIGLATAIPAVFFYNWIDRRVGDFIEELEAAAQEWVALMSEPASASLEPTVPLRPGGSARVRP